MILLDCLHSLLTAWVTYKLIKSAHQTPTRASSLVALAGIGIFYFTSQLFLLDFARLSALTLGATFVGMSSHKVINDFEVVIGGLFFAIAFAYITPHLHGVGGALGFSAFLALMSSRGLHWCLKSMRNSAVTL